jgi:hypothetical protein
MTKERRRKEKKLRKVIECIIKETKATGKRKGGGTTRWKEGIKRKRKANIFITIYFYHQFQQATYQLLNGLIAYSGVLLHL